MNIYLYTTIALACVILKCLGVITAPWWLVSAFFWVPALVFVIYFASMFCDFEEMGDWYDESND